jgi:hypothetical protein
MFLLTILFWETKYRQHQSLSGKVGWKPGAICFHLTSVKLWAEEAALVFQTKNGKLLTVKKEKNFQDMTCLFPLPHERINKSLGHK